MLAIWSLFPLPFLKPAWISGTSRFTYFLEAGLENFEHYFTNVWEECNCVVVWAFFGIAFLRDWNENWPFPVLWPLLSFPNLLTYWGTPLSQHHLLEFEISSWNSIVKILPKSWNGKSWIINMHYTIPKSWSNYRSWK